MSIQVDQKHARLVERLLVRTKAGTADWKLNSNRDPALTLTSYKVQLASEFRNGNLSEWVSLFTYYDEFIESFSDEDLAELPLPAFGAEYPSYFEMMQDLRTMAFRKAVGADAALDAVLGELDSDF